MPTVRAEVVGEGTRTVTLDADATYGDLLTALSFSPHEAAVVVDDAPVPEDRPVDFEHEVRVLRLVKGGAGTGADADANADSDADADGRPEATALADRVRVRPAGADDHLDVMRVVDGAMLTADAERVQERIDAGSVLVATAESRVVGALVREGDRIIAVATRRRWRDRGVGTALVSAALAERGRLVAEFDPDVRPFYESLGFDIERVEPHSTGGRPAADGDDGERLRGRL